MTTIIITIEEEYKQVWWDCCVIYAIYFSNILHTWITDGLDYIGGICVIFDSHQVWIIFKKYFH